MGPAGELREAVILKALAFERKTEFLKTLLISRSAILNPSSAEQIDSYKQLMQEYEDAFYYKMPAITQSGETTKAGTKEISPDMLQKVMGKKRGKMRKLSFTTGGKLEKNMQNTDLNTLAKQRMK